MPAPGITRVSRNVRLFNGRQAQTRRTVDIVAASTLCGQFLSELGPISPSEYIPEIYSTQSIPVNTVLYDQGNIWSRYSCSGSSIVNW